MSEVKSIKIGGETIELKPMKYAKYKQFASKTAGMSFDNPKAIEESFGRILEAIAIGTGKETNWLEDNLDGCDIFMVIKAIMEVNKGPLVGGQGAPAAAA